jgi:hypothetical protein
MRLLDVTSLTLTRKFKCLQNILIDAIVDRYIFL